MLDATLSNSYMNHLNLDTFSAYDSFHVILYSVIMSYKHNNLMAMRENYWNDQNSSQVIQEKAALQRTLNQLEVFENASEDDAKYVFFSLPSIIIVKGYALGFLNETVQQLIVQHIQTNKQQLQQRSPLKIQYQM